MPHCPLCRHACGLIRALPLAMVWLALTTAPSSAQTLIPGDHHLRLGEPPLLSLRVRLSDGQEPAGLLPQRCLSASLQPLDPRDGVAVTLDWQDAERNADGSTWVTLTHPAPLRLLRMLLRTTLHCGPSYTRVQRLQAELDEDSVVPVVAAVVAPVVAAEASTPLASLPSPVPVPVPVRTPSPRPTRPPPPAGPVPPAPPVQRLADAPPSQIAAPSAHLAASVSASPLTDAFMQVWQQDLRQLKDELQPLRRQVAAQEQRLSAQEDLRRDALGGLLAAGAGATALWMATRAWRERRLRRFLTEGLTAASYPEPSSVEDDARVGPSAAFDTPSVVELTVPRAVATASSTRARATLDESRHQALHDEVDKLRGTGHLGPAAALLEAALQGEDEPPPGLLLRLLDIYRRLDQPASQTPIAHMLNSLYAIDLPPLATCVLVDEFDPDGARRDLLAAWPMLAGRSDADTRQRLAGALLADGADRRLGWRDFQTALAWHAALGRSDQTSTRSMPPVLACCT
ncbi:hypothetical protein [Sphaerotilus mobilis]|uniref:Tfp pilus assembly protein FimV n=1 Tax=Sphaerotilus mobilis TaxID=47994 RepID=A0A4Q7LFD1_9BURK|nr:hypothetical protein [Sphaerotilus mobilis]RZS52028.1 hypothetical protein EV685_3215 [Sphaerotilus mobilis]